MPERELAMSKTINRIELTETLALTECNDGFWLYDKTRGMNLAMRAKTPQEAFTKALTYYQNRLTKVEQQYNNLNVKVESFVDSVTNQDEDWS